MEARAAVAVSHAPSRAVLLGGSGVVREICLHSGPIGSTWEIAPWNGAAEKGAGSGAVAKTLRS